MYGEHERDRTNLASLNFSVTIDLSKKKHMYIWKKTKKFYRIVRLTKTQFLSAKSSLWRRNSDYSFCYQVSIFFRCCMNGSGK